MKQVIGWSLIVSILTGLMAIAYFVGKLLASIFF